ncbi:MAG: hypothetical protein ABL921_09865 [Pirellula sp.]
MKLTPTQLNKLIELTVSAKADALGCDGCFALMDQFAQAELDGTSVSEELEQVRTHLEQCVCCRDEYKALLSALNEIRQSDE